MRLTIRAPLAALIVGGVAACGSPTLSVPINIIALSCDSPPVDAFAGADTVTLTAYGPDITTPVAQSFSLSGGKGSLAGIPLPPSNAPQTRIIVVEATNSTNGTLIARGESAPFTLSASTAAPNVTVWVHPIDSFSYVASDPPAAAGVCQALTQGRAGHTATVLENGKVLIAGGYSVSGSQTMYLNTTEIFDPVTGLVTVGSTMGHARAYHTATHIPGTNFTVLAGGEAGANVSCTSDSQCQQGYACTNNFCQAKLACTADSQCMAGYSCVSSLCQKEGILALPVSEIYDESVDKFAGVAMATSTGRTRHAAVLAPASNGAAPQVLLIGGYTSNDASLGANSPLKTGEVLQTNPLKWVDAGFTLSTGLAEMGAVVVGQRVLIEGGWTGTAANTTGFYLSPNPMGLYTKANAPGISAPHLFPLLSIVGNSSPQDILIAGGFLTHDMTSHQPANAQLVTEFFNAAAVPPPNGFTMMGSPNTQLTDPRGFGAMIALPDTTVLLSGGQYVGGAMGTFASSTTADVLYVNPDNSTTPLLKRKTAHNPKTGRYGHTLTLLPDNRVLVTGGVNIANGMTTMATKFEVYEPRYVGANNNPHSPP